VLEVHNETTLEGPDLPTALDEAQKRLQTAVTPGQINLEGQTMTDDPAVKRTKNSSTVGLCSHCGFDQDTGWAA
jgi:hypothetical protein